MSDTQAKEKREAAIQYLKIISYTLSLIMMVVGVVIAFKYAQVMTHVSDMMDEAAASVSDSTSNDSDYAGGNDYSSSDY